MIKRHGYERTCNQSAILNYLQEITTYWFAGWTLKCLVCSGSEAYIKKTYKLCQSQFSKILTLWTAE